MDTVASRQDRLEAEHTPRPGLSVLLASAAFLVTAMTLGSISDRLAGEPPRVAVLDAKLDHLAAHWRDYDIVFIGASRVYRHIDAPALDAAMAARGCPLRSFNMGVPALNILEQDHVLTELARIGRMPWVMLESLPAMPGPMGNLDSPRLQRHLATGDHLLRALADQWQAPKPLHQRLGTMGELVIAWAYRHIGFGRLNRALLADDGPPPTEFDERLDMQGYLPLELEKGERFRERRGQGAGATLEAAIERLPQPEHDGPVGERRLEHLRSQTARAHAAAENVGFVFQPFIDAHELSDNRALAKLSPSDLGASLVINLNDPARHPELFQAAAWYDYGHLTREAAAGSAEGLAGSSGRRAVPGDRAGT